MVDKAIRSRLSMRKMEPPITSEGVTYSESVDEIIWRGGIVGILEFDRFNLLALMPRKANTKIYFRTIQECEKGENKWVEIPEEGRSWGSYKYPAPFVETGDTVAPAKVPNQIQDGEDQSAQAR